MRFWISLVFALLGLAVLLSLGFWQVGRIGEKSAEIARIDAYIDQAPVALPMDPTEADEYLPVNVTGTFLMPEIHVLVSTRDYGAGYRIIAPFETTDGRTIMLDRGYVRHEFKNGPRLQGDFSITGNLHWPNERSRWTPEDDPASNIWYARDVAKMAEALGTEPILVIAKTVTDEGTQPIPVSSSYIPNNHFSYAVQWFLFAAIWLGMTSVLLWRIRGQRA